MRLSYRAYLIPRLLAAALLLTALLGAGGTVDLPGWVPGALFLMAGAVILTLIILGMRIKAADDARSVVDALPEDTAARIWTAVRGQDRAEIPAMLAEAGVASDRVAWVSRYLTTRATKI